MFLLKMQCNIGPYSICILNVSTLKHIKDTRGTIIPSSKVPLLITHEVYFSVLSFALL